MAKDNKNLPAELNKLIHRTSTFLEILESGPKEERERFASPKRIQAHFNDCQQSLELTQKKIERMHVLSAKMRPTSTKKTYQRPKTPAQILSEALAPKPPRQKVSIEVVCSLQPIPANTQHSLSQDIKDIIQPNMHSDKYSPAKHWRTENKDSYKRSKLMLSL